MTNEPNMWGCYNQMLLFSDWTGDFIGSINLRFQTGGGNISSWMLQVEIMGLRVRSMIWIVNEMYMNS